MSPQIPNFHQIQTMINQDQTSKLPRLRLMMKLPLVSPNQLMNQIRAKMDKVVNKRARRHLHRQMMRLPVKLALPPVRRVPQLTEVPFKLAMMVPTIMLRTGSRTAKTNHQHLRQQLTMLVRTREEPSNLSLRLMKAQARRKRSQTTVGPWNAS